MTWCRWAPAARRKAAACAFALAVAVAPARASDDGPRVLPAVSLYIEAARYAPVDVDMHWTGTAGGGADLLRIRRTSAYILGDVETVIGNTRRAFDAAQANYTLETGLRHRRARTAVELLFHHVSRHAIDRDKPQAVDWNLLGVRASGAWPDHTVPVRLAASLGHTTLASLVGYRWELTAAGDAELVKGAGAAFYTAARARLVTVEPEPPLTRNGFVDYSAEAGIRLPRQERVLEVFAAFERRNDVFLLTPGARSRALFGFRVLMATREGEGGTGLAP